MAKIKALIILPTGSRFSPARVGEFLFNSEHQAHIWAGRPLDMDEFNAISRRIFYERRDDIEVFDLPPYVQLVEVPEDEQPAEEAQTSKGNPVLQPAPIDKPVKAPRGAVPKAELSLPDPKKL